MNNRKINYQFRALKKTIKELEAENAKMKEAGRELVYDAMNMYEHIPNNFRKSAREYFAEEISIFGGRGDNWDEAH